MDNDSKKSAQFLIGPHSDDLELGHLLSDQRHARAKLRHKVIVLTLLGFALFVQLASLLGDQSNEVARDFCKKWLENEDCGDAVDRSTKLASLIFVIWYALMCFVVVREKHCLLVFGLVVNGTSFVLNIATTGMFMTVAPAKMVPLFAMAFVVACIWGAVFLYSMCRLIRLVERNGPQLA